MTKVIPAVRWWYTYTGAAANTQTPGLSSIVNRTLVNEPRTTERSARKKGGHATVTFAKENEKKKKENAHKINRFSKVLRAVFNQQGQKIIFTKKKKKKNCTFYV